MDSSLESALELARRGFHVIPIPKNKKAPVIENWVELAANDPEKVKELWTNPPPTKFKMRQPFNIGISMKTFNGSEGYLVAIDIDNKDGKKGWEQIKKWEAQGLVFPPTYMQITPTEGGHLILRTKIPLTNSVCELGEGIDIRGVGGQVLGVGSLINGKKYILARDVEPAWAPDWFINLCNVQRPKQEPIAAVIDLDRERVVKRAAHFLDHEAPIALEGDGGTTQTYKVAAELKDFGLSIEDTLDLMTEWNERCQPPWNIEDLVKIINCAFQYGKNARGSAAPEADFPRPVSDSELLAKFPRPLLPQLVSEPPTPPPPVAPQDPDTNFVEELNKNYAFCINGSKHIILWETENFDQQQYTHWLSLDTFHEHLAWWKIEVGTEDRPKKVAASKLWMASKDKRWYQGLCFKPYTLGAKDPAATKRFYNLFRGFPLLPFGEDEQPTQHAQEAFEAYLNHAYENISQKNQEHFDFLIGFFAHLFQFPQIKPHSSIVLRGPEGVGKNAFIDRIGVNLLANRYYMETAKEKDLTGQFTDHLENLLLFCLTEAFWGGEKKADGILRDLVTNDTQNIEHKFGDKFKVDNRTRFVIVGNAKWVVPAALDARRWAVYDVGDGRVNDKKFFKWMQQGMEAGGNKLLMRHFLDFDLNKIDVNNPPRTAALLQQKYASMSSFHQWWLDCLSEGRIVCSNFEHDDWPLDVSKEEARSAYRRYTQEKNIRAQIDTGYRAFGYLIKSVVPVVDGEQKTRDSQGNWVSAYRLPELAVCRKMWEDEMKQEVTW